SFLTSTIPRLGLVSLGFVQISGREHPLGYRIRSEHGRKDGRSLNQSLFVDGYSTTNRLTVDEVTDAWASRQGNCVGFCIKLWGKHNHAAGKSAMTASGRGREASSVASP